MSKNLLKNLFIRRATLVSEDTDILERLVEYYANGEMSEKEFEQAKAQLTAQNIRTVFDKCYKAKLSEQTKNAQNAMRAKGRTTGYAPLGYKNITKPNGEHDVVPERKIANRVKQLFEIYANEKCTLEELARVAKCFGLRGKITKQPLTKVAIKNIISNPFYYGYGRHKGKLFKHNYKPLISKKLFSMCEEKLFKETR